MCRSALRPAALGGFLLALSLAGPFAAGASAHHSRTHRAAALPDYAAAVGSPRRSGEHIKLDAGRMPVAVLTFAGIRRGETVADFFAGGGYYSEILAEAVGPRGVVYALNPSAEHDPKAWDAIRAQHPNVRTIVAPLDAAVLPPHSIDTLFTHLNYHDLYWQSDKYHMPRVEVPTVLARWFAAVRPGGQVIIVDHAGPAGDPRAVADRLHRIDPERVKADMAAAGFRFVAASSVLQRSDDDHEKLVFDPSVRGKTDRFVLKFRRP